ncbi:hypothetical protein diail_5645 [Diaporthe ilicicola]|nr:hypothetical protein diail_5645 [Diaporthe ilicicola]
MINVGSLTGIITTLLEKNIGFGVAFLMPLILIVLAMIIFVASSKLFVKHGPSKGNLARTTAYVVARLRARLKHSKASNQVQRFQEPTHDAKFSKDMSDTWKACRMFSTFTIAWLCWDQGENNLISQAGQMNTIGVPNDMIYFLNPVVLVIFIPCFEEIVFPFLRSRGAKLPQLSRIFVGFIILAISMAYVAGLQALIYSRGPCYERPRACPDSPNGTLPNNVSAFAQIPVYVLQSIAEIFSQITATEYAYSQAPVDMRSLMQAIAQSFGALAAVLGVAIAPVSRDPWLTTLYACMAAAMAVTCAIFWFLFMRREEQKTEIVASLDLGPTLGSAAESREGL